MKRTHLALGLAAVALLATACGSTAVVDTDAAESVTVTNCDRPISLSSSPSRIISLYPSMTELLIEMGAADRIVGQANTGLSTPSPNIVQLVARMMHSAECAGCGCCW